MGAEIHGYIDEAEDFELDPGLSHQVHSAAINAIAAQGVLEKVHFNARSGALCQSLSKRIRYVALSQEEILIVRCAERIASSRAGKI
jgi:hypothetical protein